MDNELILRQFEKVEEKVERLIADCRALGTTNSELKNKVDSLEEELQRRIEAENKLSDERVLIRTRIDSLLAKFDDLSDSPSSP